MTDHQDDTEQYAAEFNAAFRRLFAVLVAEGWSEAAAKREANFDAAEEVEQLAQTARDNADACRENRWADAHEHA